MYVKVYEESKVYKYWGEGVSEEISREFDEDKN